MAFDDFFLPAVKLKVIYHAMFETIKVDAKAFQRVCPLIKGESEYQTVGLMYFLERIDAFIEMVPLHDSKAKSK